MDRAVVQSPQVRVWRVPTFVGVDESQESGGVTFPCLRNASPSRSGSRSVSGSFRSGAAYMAAIGFSAIARGVDGTNCMRRCHGATAGYAYFDVPVMRTVTTHSGRGCMVPPRIGL